MLTFLRKIRKSLIESGSTRKYLLYAIREILLVMIGILLALQVNNWNLHRLETIEEQSILKDLFVEFKANERDIIRNKKAHALFYSSIEELQSISNSNKISSNQIDSLLFSSGMAEDGI